MTFVVGWQPILSVEWYESIEDVFLDFSINFYGLILAVPALIIGYHTLRNYKRREKKDLRIANAILQVISLAIMGSDIAIMSGFGFGIMHGLFLDALTQALPLLISKFQVMIISPIILLLILRSDGKTKEPSYPRLLKYP